MDALSMTIITAARLCRLYQKAKAGSEAAYRSLRVMGLEGSKIEVLRTVEKLIGKDERCPA
jgi:hypothetical protein